MAFSLEDIRTIEEDEDEDVSPFELSLVEKNWFSYHGVVPADYII